MCMYICMLMPCMYVCMYIHSAYHVKLLILGITFGPFNWIRFIHVFSLEPVRVHMFNFMYVHVHVLQ